METPSRRQFTSGELTQEELAKLQRADAQVDQAERQLREQRLAGSTAKSLENAFPGTELGVSVDAILAAARELLQTAEEVEGSALLHDLHVATYQKEYTPFTNPFEASSPESALFELRAANLEEALRRQFALDDDRTKYTTVVQLFSELRKQNPGDPSLLKAMDLARGQLLTIAQQEAALLQSSPEAFYGLHLRELKKMQAELAKGRIVETPYVQAQADKIEASLRAGIPVLLHGHLGSGKTELASHVAKTRFKKDPVVISGSRDMSPSDVYGKYQLEATSISNKDILAVVGQITQLLNEWNAQNPAATEADKENAHATISAAALTRLESNTVSQFLLGPLYTAMQEGRILIIDELNAIPHEILIGLNFLLTRKPGDKITVQQNGGQSIVVEEGFGVIGTANFNKTGGKAYVGRQEVDAAFGSRFSRQEYDYLPQVTEGAFTEIPNSAQKEQFMLLLARLMNRRGEMTLPEGAMEQLWDLAKAARVIQDVFSGKAIGQSHYFESGGQSVEYRLKSTVLSQRALEKVIVLWQASGFSRTLDECLYTEFITQAEDPTDKAYLFQTLKRYNFFRESQGWPGDQNINYGTNGKVNSFDVAVPQLDASTSLQKTFYAPRNVIDVVYGKAPERTVWPDLASEAATDFSADKAGEQAGWEDVQNRIAEQIGNLRERIFTVCPVS